MSGEGECLYYWVQNGLDSIRHEEEWVAEQQAKLEAAREALLVRCGWTRGWTRHPEGHLRAMWSRGAFRHVTTTEALTAVREAYEILTGSEKPGVKPDDCPGDLS